MRNFFSFFLFSFLFGFSLEAQIVIPLQKGWTLVGMPEPLSDMSHFDSKNVELIWSYDAKNQKWLGYAPQRELMAKMEEKGIEKLHSLDSHNAMWIKSKEDWILSFDIAPSVSQAPREIKLYKGWNLVSLPANMRLSPKFFGEDVVWHYSEEGEWESSGVEDVATKPLTTISNKSGLWIYSDVQKSLELDGDASKLSPFEDEKSMRNYIREMALNHNRPYYGCIEIMPLGLPMPVDGALPTSSQQDAALDSGEATKESATDATTTNLQEDGVDEADIVKHDNDKIFYLFKTENTILVTSFDSAASLSPKLLAKLTLNPDYEAEELYIYDNRLVVLYASGYNKINALNQSQALIEIYNIEDVNSITKLKSFLVDGSMVNSRMIGKNLYFISRFYPSIAVEYPKEYIDCSKNELGYENYLCGYARYGDESSVSGEPIATEPLPPLISGNKAASAGVTPTNSGYYVYDYSKPTITAEYLTPKFSVDFQDQELLAPKRFYAPNKLDQRASIISISEINLEALELTDTISFLGETTHEYLSENSLYLVSREYPHFYDFTNHKHQSVIYKFKLSALSFEAQGVVDGYVINQFSLSELEETLRIATTSGFSWSQSGTSNALFTLESQEGKLNLIGSLDGLGKENETIKAVRFMGERAYVVTFFESDPFYTIDLSDPKEPKKIGELEISGFSEYIHPIDANRILSVGRDADPSGRRLGIMIQLFDVSDFANPALLDKVVIGDSNYHTELSYNHKAFTYRASDSLFGFAYTNYNYWSSMQNIFGYYHIENNTIASLGDLKLNIDTNYKDAQSRAIFFNQDSKRIVLLFSGGKFIAKEVK